MTIVLRLRTRNNLLDILQAGKSGNWKVAQVKEKHISNLSATSDIQTGLLKKIW